MLSKILKYRPAAANACILHACQIFKHMLSMRFLQFCRASPVKDEGIGGLDERVTAVYKGVGLIMKRFTTGKVPKAFKIIPNLQNWEEVRPPCLDCKLRIIYVRYCSCQICILCSITVQNMLFLQAWLLRKIHDLNA